MRDFWEWLWYPVGFFTTMALALVTVIVLAVTVPDFFRHNVMHFTPGVVRDRQYTMYNYDSYRLNADGTVTFRDQMTNTWLTLPQERLQLVPRRTWWWQRMVP